jgi:hypothetical protein
MLKNAEKSPKVNALGSKLLVKWAIFSLILTKYLRSNLVSYNNIPLGDLLKT